jgi:site-specific DNA-methyltransferase (adenine-specific)
MRTENIHLLLAVYQKVAPHAFPYLVMMALWILELHRVLKPTGSFYLHCDPTMIHYLKTVCDSIFGDKNYRNEIVWHYGQRTDTHKGHFSRKHDIIMLFAKSDKTVLNPLTIPWEREEFLEHRHDVKVDKSGKEFIWTNGGEKE